MWDTRVCQSFEKNTQETWKDTLKDTRVSKFFVGVTSTLTTEYALPRKASALSTFVQSQNAKHQKLRALQDAICQDKVPKVHSWATIL